MVEEAFPRGNVRVDAHPAIGSLPLRLPEGLYRDSGRTETERENGGAAEFRAYLPASCDCVPKTAVDAYREFVYGAAMPREVRTTERMEEHTGRVEDLAAVARSMRETKDLLSRACYEPRLKPHRNADYGIDLCLCDPRFPRS